METKQMTVADGMLNNLLVYKGIVAKSNLTDNQKSMIIGVINQVLAKWNSPERYVYLQKAYEAARLYKLPELAGLNGELAGFWSSVGNFVKKAIPVAASFIPGAGGLISSVTSGLLNRSDSQPQEQAAAPSSAAPIQAAAIANQSGAASAAMANTASVSNSAVASSSASANKAMEQTAAIANQSAAHQQALVANITAMTQKNAEANQAMAANAAVSVQKAANNQQIAVVQQQAAVERAAAARQAAVLKQAAEIQKMADSKAAQIQKQAFEIQKAKEALKPKPFLSTTGGKVTAVVGTAVVGGLIIYGVNRYIKHRNRKAR